MLITDICKRKAKMPQQIWIKGKFVAPLESRNDLRSSILLQFIKEAPASSDIKLA